jgi:NADH:ubiquinone oxidoreductase subunit K
LIVSVVAALVVVGLAIYLLSSRGRQAVDDSKLLTKD